MVLNEKGDKYDVIKMYFIPMNFNFKEI